MSPHGLNCFRSEHPNEGKEVRENIRGNPATLKSLYNIKIREHYS